MKMLNYKEVNMNKTVKLILVIVVLLGFISLPLLSQSRENGAIEGKVTTETGEGVFGATVNLTSPSMIGGERTILTGLNGQFRFVAFLPGIYSLGIVAGGYDPQKLTDIRVSMGKTLTVDFQLKLKTLTETVDSRKNDILFIKIRQIKK